MSAEMWGGDIVDFEAAAQRCPFLNSLGESALADIKAEYEVLAAQDALNLTQENATTATEPDRREKKQPDEASPQQREVEQQIQPVAAESVQNLAPVLRQVETIAEKPHADILEPENRRMVEDTPSRIPMEIQEQLMGMRQDVLPEPAGEPASIKEAVPPVALPERPPLVADISTEVEPLAGTEIETSQPEPLNMEATEPAAPTLEIAVANKAEQPTVQPKEATGPSEMPVDIAELLAEPLPETTQEVTADEPISPIVEVEEMAPLLSVQLETLVAETVVPQQHKDATELIAQVYELAALPVEGTIVSEHGGEQPAEVTEELERAVVQLLQALGISEPAAEQIERFIARVRTEVQATERQPAAAETIDTGMHEQLHGLIAATGYLHLPYFRPGQVLGRLVLGVH